MLVFIISMAVCAPEGAGVWEISVLGLLSRCGSVALVELKEN